MWHKAKSMENSARIKLINNDQLAELNNHHTMQGIHVTVNDSKMFKIKII